MSDNSNAINPMAQPILPELAPFYDKEGFSIVLYLNYQEELRLLSPSLCRQAREAGWTDEAVWKAIGQARGRFGKLELLKDLWEAHNLHVQELMRQGKAVEVPWPDFRNMARRINVENPVGSPAWFLNNYLTEKSKRVSGDAICSLLSKSLDYSRRHNDTLEHMPQAKAKAATVEELPPDSLTELEFRRIVKMELLREGVKNMLSQCVKKQQFVEVCRLIIKRKQLTYKEMIRKENIVPLLAMTPLTTSYDRIQRAVSKGCRDLDEE